MELGLITFADMEPEHLPGKAIGTHQRIQELMEEIQLADELGLDVFGVGEHHRPDYAVSSPATLLAAAAVSTKNIRLSSAVTVLSSDDPVRVFQQFALVDQLSGGRAEIMAGRGSFTESFPLFGYDLNDYDELFTEKLELLLKINQNEKLSWEGTFRPSFSDRGIYPRPFQQHLPIWIAAGGTPASAVRAARLGLPLMLAIIGGRPEQFAPFVNLYYEAAERAGKNRHEVGLGINNHVYVAENSQQASEEFYPYYAAMMDRVGLDRGWPKFTRERFEYMREPEGALMVGSVQQVIDKIMYEHQLFGYTRFMAQASVGNVPHDKIMRSIELFGTKVAPVIRKALG